MNDQGCAACAVKDMIITYQRFRIRMLENEIRRLRAIIRRSREACQRTIAGADEIMSQHQPRGRWAWAKAARVAAVYINSFLAG